MKNKFLLAVVYAMLLLTSCAQSNTSSTMSASSDSTDSIESSVVSSEPTSESEIADSGNEIGGSYEQCEEHIWSYHSIVISLIDYVGFDTYNEWSESFSDTNEFGRLKEDFSIQSFIEHFQIPREDFEDCINIWVDSVIEADPTEDRDEYLEEYGYTDAQIDALYSGDQAKINEAFCGEMAYYNPEDGQLYSIYWLSDHTAEEYESAGIPETEVERILGLAEEAGGGYARFAEEAGEAAAEYAAMN